MPNFNDNADFVWRVTGRTFGDWYSGENHDSIYSYATEIKVPEEVRKNGSYYLYVFLVRTGDSPIPSEDSKDEQTVHKVKQLNHFKNMKRLKPHNLPTEETNATNKKLEVSVFKS